MLCMSTCSSVFVPPSDRSLSTASAGFSSRFWMSASTVPKAARCERSDPRGHAASAIATSALSGVAGSYCVSCGGERTAAQLRSSMILGVCFPNKRSMRSLSSSDGESAGSTSSEDAASTSRLAHNVSGSAQTMSSAKPSGREAFSVFMASLSSAVGHRRTRMKSLLTGSKNQFGCSNEGASPSTTAATCVRKREGGDTWSSPQKATTSPEHAGSSSLRLRVSASFCVKSLSTFFRDSGASPASSDAPRTTTSCMRSAG
mmetsp:Transcript_30962/g.62432  ORF Transcript_30962/g.62432 Transcript_30962/m.62432 type:complete len:259 (+) Transcript_30962:9-785(+)